MRLDYKLLWVEDDIHWITTYEEIFSEYLLDIGFKLDVKRLTKAPSGHELLALDPDKFHLILMDYNLGTGASGKDVIQNIRNIGAITEVVFYSSDDKFYEEIKGLPLEGVYWTSRDEDKFESRIKEIIQLTIRRVMDLPAMRGLAIAEIADIDFLMNKIISLRHNKLDDPDKKKLCKEIYDKIKASAESSLKKINKNEATCLNEIDFILTENGFIDSDKRWRTINNFIAHCGLNERCCNLLDDFKNTLKQRNDLAHGHSITEAGTEKIKGKNNTYSLEHAIEIRKKLLEHRDNFEQIYDIIR